MNITTSRGKQSVTQLYLIVESSIQIETYQFQCTLKNVKILHSLVMLHSNKILNVTLAKNVQYITIYGVSNENFKHILYIFIFI